jgi:GNAT superfamily N-acetyltransferase
VDPLKIYRATEMQTELAYELVQEYYAAACVVAREGPQEFAEQYFGEGAGIWLAEVAGNVVGCVALRELVGTAGAAEIKRLYLRPKYRGQGVSDLLLDALEDHARECGYHWLYLDTAAEMKAAVRFYQRKGFVECERYNKNPQAALFMRKAIR